MERIFSAYTEDFIGHEKSRFLRDATRLDFTDEQAVFISTSQANTHAGRVGEERDVSRSGTKREIELQWMCFSSRQTD